MAFFTFFLFTLLMVTLRRTNCLSSSLGTIQSKIRQPQNRGLSVRNQLKNESGKIKKDLEELEIITNYLQRSLSSCQSSKSNNSDSTNNNDSMSLSFINQSIDQCSKRLKGFSKANTVVIAEKAEKILYLLEEIHESEKIKSNNDVVLNNRNIISNMDDEHTDSNYVEDDLYKYYFYDNNYFEEDGNHNSILFGPNLITYNSIITLWARSGDENSGQKAEELLSYMEMKSSKSPNIKPDIVTYSSVLDAWAKCNNPIRAQRILDNLLERQNENKYLKSYDFEEVIHDIGPAETEKSIIEPNKFCFSCVINAWARSGLEESGQKAEELLYRMIDFKKKGLIDFYPNTVIYNAVMNAWAKSGQVIAPAKAEALLDLLETQYKACYHSSVSIQNDNLHDMMPNTVSYTTVISAWARSRMEGSGRRAIELLDRMESLSPTKEYGSGLFLRPNVVTYSCVIDAIAKSNEKYAYKRAYKIFERMISDDSTKHCRLKPNIITYSATLKACANTRGSQEERMNAFRVAIKVYKHLAMSKLELNQITYSILIDVYGYLLKRPYHKNNKLSTQKQRYQNKKIMKLREKGIEKFFIKSVDKQEGEVDLLLLAAIRRHLSPPKVNKLLRTMSKYKRKERTQ